MSRAPRPESSRPLAAAPGVTGPSGREAPSATAVLLLSSLSGGCIFLPLFSEASSLASGRGVERGSAPHRRRGRGRVCGPGARVCGPGARVPGQLVAARESSGLGPLRPALWPRRLSVGWGRSLFPPAPPASTHCFAKQARRRRASSEGQASPASESNFCSEPHSPTRVVARFFFKGAALT